MNCRRIEEMIPLYVEGDLEADRAELVSAHLKSCLACSRLAGGFDESQEWLRSYTPPAFDSSFFNGLKNGVLARIEDEKARPSFFQLMIARWRWNAALTAAALLLIIGGIVFYAYQRSPGAIDRQVAGHDPQPTEVPAPQERDEPRKEEPQRFAGPTQRPHRTIREVVAKAVEPARPELVLSGVFTDPASEDASGPVVEDAAVSESQVETQTSVKVTYPVSESLTRIEIQTSDPTIRIIWFAPNLVDKNSGRRSTDS